MRRFVMQMTYGCETCDFEVPMLLEEGCEEPRVDSGWVPVPFVAGRCPRCPEKRFLSHVRWNEDVVLDPPLVREDDVPHFRYPTREERRQWGEQACGVPVLPTPPDEEVEA